MNIKIIQNSMLKNILCCAGALFMLPLLTACYQPLEDYYNSRDDIPKRVSSYHLEEDNPRTKGQYEFLYQD